jgi:hypothetical protein
MTNRSFLLCESPEHAEVVDHLIAERLREVDGSKCSQWSGTYSDGERYGVLWASPASELFGLPYDPITGEGDESIVIAEEVFDEESGESDWSSFVVEVPAEESPL